MWQCPRSLQVKTVTVNGCLTPQSLTHITIIYSKRKKKCHIYRAGGILGQKKHNLREKNKSVLMQFSLPQAVTLKMSSGECHCFLVFQGLSLNSTVFEGGPSRVGAAELLAWSLLVWLSERRSSFRRKQSPLNCILTEKIK